MSGHIFYGFLLICMTIMIHLDLFACCKPGYVLVSVVWGTTPLPLGGNGKDESLKCSENVFLHL